MCAAEQFPINVSTANGVVDGVYAQRDITIGSVDDRSSDSCLYGLGVAAARGGKKPKEALGRVATLREAVWYGTLRDLSYLHLASSAIEQALQEHSKGTISEDQYWQRITCTQTDGWRSLHQHPHFGDSNLPLGMRLVRSLPIAELVWIKHGGDGGNKQESLGVRTIESVKGANGANGSGYFPIGHTLRFESPPKVGRLVTLQFARVVDGTWPESLTRLLDPRSVEGWDGYRQPSQP